MLALLAVYKAAIAAVEGGGCRVWGGIRIISQS